MVQHNGPPCTKSDFDLQRTAKIWFLGTANQPTFAAIKQLEITSVALQQSALYLPCRMVNPCQYNTQKVDADSSTYAKNRGTDWAMDFSHDPFIIQQGSQNRVPGTGNRTFFTSGSCPICGLFHFRTSDFFISRNYEKIGYRGSTSFIKGLSPTDMPTEATEACSCA